MVLALCAEAKAPKIARLKFDPAVVNDATLTDRVIPGARGSRVLRAQILLDRANFSSGEIDGNYGKNMRNAVSAFQKTRALTETGTIDADTWTALNNDSANALGPYAIDTQDVAGPFVKIPPAMADKAKLAAANYESALEGLAEKFHCSPSLLKTLNPGAAFDHAGDSIMAPNVGNAPVGAAASVLVDGGDGSVSALDASGKVLAHFPATTGSVHDPLPVGTWKILGVKRNPVFHYNPDLFWDADAKEERAILPAGPNNPVGAVWITLSKEHYGIHGTPEPSKIGYTQSHGCIRLTNWDALKLAGMVKAGVPAILQE